MRTRFLALLSVAALAVAALVTLTSSAGADCSTSGCRADVGMWGSTIPSRIKPSKKSYSLVYFTAKDNGPASAYGIDMHITVPSGLKIIYARDYAAQGSCTVKGTFVDCYLGNFKREQLADITIKVQPRVNNKQATYEIPAHVYSQGVDDPNGGNNQGTDTLQVYKN